MGKKILILTSPPPHDTLSPFYLKEKLMPIGVGFLISILKNADHQVDFIDLFLKKQPLPSFEDYDYIAISSNTVCFRGTLELINEAKLARKRGWEGKIIVGGPHTSVAPETIPDVVDYVIIGEGEKAILDVVEDKITHRLIRYERIQNLDELPFPAYNYFVNQGYDEKTSLIPEAKRVFSYSSSRGCPFNCTFCSSKNIWGKHYTFFSPERVTDDLKRLKEDYNIDGVYFREDNFSVNKNRTEKICELMIKKTPGLLWATESRVDTLSESLIKLMYNAGCRGLYFGIEGGNQKILDQYKKQITLKQIEDVFKFSKNVGIKCYASFIIDTPEETYEDRIDLLKLIDKIEPDFFSLNHYTGLPGSELYDYSVNEKKYTYVDDIGLLIMPFKQYPKVSSTANNIRNKLKKKLGHFGHNKIEFLC